MKSTRMIKSAKMIPVIVTISSPYFPNVAATGASRGPLPTGIKEWRQGGKKRTGRWFGGGGALAVSPVSYDPTSGVVYVAAGMTHRSTRSRKFQMWWTVLRLSSVSAIRFRQARRISSERD
jgi:hypothetical protein